MVEHAAGVRMVMGLRCRELLDQLGVALQRSAIEDGELLARQRCALPDVFQQLCRRGIASRDAADSGRSSPFGRSVAGVGDGAAATEARFRWNRESMRVS